MDYTNDDVTRAFSMFADEDALRGSISKTAIKTAIVATKADLAT